MASVKLSELQTIPEILETDLLYIADTDTQTSRKTTVGQLFSSATLDQLGDYQIQQEMNLQAGIATGYLYVKDLTVGG